MTHLSANQRPAVLPEGLLETARNRAVEILGVILMLGAIFVTVSLVSYVPSDPSFNSAGEAPVQNNMGPLGAIIADLLIQLFGLASVFAIVILAAWGWRLVRRKSVALLWLRLMAFAASMVLAAIALAAVPEFENWPLRTGLGGVSGSILLASASQQLAPYAAGYEVSTVVATATLLGLLNILFASALERAEWRAMVFGMGSGIRASLRVGITQVGRQAQRFRFSNQNSETRIEPVLGPGTGNETEDEDLSVPPISGARKPTPEVTNKPKEAPAGSRSKSARQGNLSLEGSREYQLPPLDLVEAPPEIESDPAHDKVALANNAKLLESVLLDFGIKGEIVTVRPGPVVTLYELEPAPGIKTSRVISLADDIARSMSALSVRIAVVPGRSVIGIELPNGKRDMVYFRELLASRAFERSGSALALALGKDIGGGPMVVDLARMPHLLIAGTTGSGKSVAVNTMILSLLYQHPPDACKFIMIDPKMLELSVYDGIPNLLSPVVTDPSKAVVALKWAVREMEDRYRAMSQLGVRNISGYNARLAEARKKDEELTRRLQTGFDEAGKPIYEDQPLNLDPLPLIVVVVDEMADLMMVAGKDIEAAIQRLAQMARAAGIHLIMATQRPSVDVITGTIKANFPTRVSFQVTSKIDSRTILGEQGAEQLLGQGDMLYMAAGGQVARIHGPFVSDEEVERIVAFLKCQGTPEYIDAITEDDGQGFDIPDLTGGNTGKGDDALYDQAIALVAREGKASTSFIQRHLQIGYNRAARIIEQMEEQNVVSKADRVGRREVLIGEH
ncbi:MAG: DNA translocase FtsK 4TM domain-containing protein [Pseudomonadota bacterium]|nr:DNA translocase FtsK 4TM domain-containing protein [Pseudomonadota bacterium]